MITVHSREDRAMQLEECTSLGITQRMIMAGLSRLALYIHTYLSADVLLRGCPTSLLPALVCGLGYNTISAH